MPAHIKSGLPHPISPCLNKSSCVLGTHHRDQTAPLDQAQGWTSRQGWLWCHIVLPPVRFLAKHFRNIFWHRSSVIQHRMLFTCWDSRRGILEARDALEERLQCRCRKVCKQQRCVLRSSEQFSIDVQSGFTCTRHLTPSIPMEPFCQNLLQGITRRSIDVQPCFPST